MDDELSVVDELMALPLTLVEISNLLLFQLPYPLNIWIYCLLSVQLIGLLYVSQEEGTLAIISLLLDLVLLASIYTIYGGMVRLCAISHIGWVVAIPCLIYRLVMDTEYYLADDKPLFFFPWVLLYTLICSISLVLDTANVIRWIRGDHAFYIKPMEKLD